MRRDSSREDFLNSALIIVHFASWWESFCTRTDGFSSVTQVDIFERVSTIVQCSSLNETFRNAEVFIVEYWKLIYDYVAGLLQHNLPFLDRSFFKSAVTTQRYVFTWKLHSQPRASHEDAHIIYSIQTYSIPMCIHTYTHTGHMHFNWSCSFWHLIP